MILDGIEEQIELNKRNCIELERKLGLIGIDPSPAQGWGQIQLTDISSKLFRKNLCTLSKML